MRCGYVQDSSCDWVLITGQRGIRCSMRMRQVDEGSFDHGPDPKSPMPKAWAERFLSNNEIVQDKTITGRRGMRAESRKGRCQSEQRDSGALHDIIHTIRRKQLKTEAEMWQLRGIQDRGRVSVVILRLLGWTVDIQSSVCLMRSREKKFITGKVRFDSAQSRRAANEGQKFDSRLHLSQKINLVSRYEYKGL
ncbi:hypothetical protein PPACK8108_LOCUS13343 [Phakopsora pachyrhizi]|uniref:Uncharacterized protein n=1 Tax=Phakopsora pachyrhizi TaxID=170000 RepID=A0AAV0B5J9_PHAPC|nr:hypothetical protein PPACK8108_LOCUS13343 [Phakopsora pachyrhizi]